ncbi:MAG: nitroreductase family protein [Ktedonobacteraceae bacterium]|nr:nitroreductase family protein [Ktedonobacteraceae bacterium]
MPILDLTIDELLSTTRSVRKRLDLTRPVEAGVLQECIALAMQAPLPPIMKIHFIIVTDPSQRAALADLYRKGSDLTVPYREQALATATDGKETLVKILDSSQYLADHLHEVPVHVIPCIEGRAENTSATMQAGIWGSILPATWSFMLAARSRGLGTVLTGNHLLFEQEAAEVLGISYEQVTQAALIPVAYTLGTRFQPATRPPLTSVLHWNHW